MILDLPLIEQTKDYDCGHAVYSCVCSYWLAKAKKVTADPLIGFHPFQLEPTLRQTGFLVQSGSMDIDDLRHHCNLYRPVICNITSKGGGHYIVVAGVSRGFVKYMDPTPGEIVSMRVDDFKASWLDIDRNANIFRRYGIAVWME